jgi:hypothetical protein
MDKNKTPKAKAQTEFFSKRTSIGGRNKKDFYESEKLSMLISDDKRNSTHSKQNLLKVQAPSSVLINSGNMQNKIMSCGTGNILSPPSAIGVIKKTKRLLSSRG